MVTFNNEEEYRKYESDTTKSEYDKVVESQHYFYIKYALVAGKSVEQKISDLNQFMNRMNKDWYDVMLKAAQEGKEIRIIRGRSREYLMIKAK